MSLAILFHFLCAQHVSDINISFSSSSSSYSPSPCSSSSPPLPSSASSAAAASSILSVHTRCAMAAECEILWQMLVITSFAVSVTRFIYAL